MEITYIINPKSTELICNSYWGIYESNILPSIYIITKKINIYIIDSNYIQFEQQQNNFECYCKCFSYFRSSCLIYKNNKDKIRIFIQINPLYKLCLYSYFIYNKYYNKYNNSKYYHYLINDAINEKKLFNCRDFYKIFSFI